MNTKEAIEKVEKMIKKYNEEIESWKQENSREE